MLSTCQGRKGKDYLSPEPRQRPKYKLFCVCHQLDVEVWGTDDVGDHSIELCVDLGIDRWVVQKCLPAQLHWRIKPKKQQEVSQQMEHFSICYVSIYSVPGYFNEHQIFSDGDGHVTGLVHGTFPQVHQHRVFVLTQRMHFHCFGADHIAEFHLCLNTPALYLKHTTVVGCWQ